MYVKEIGFGRPKHTWQDNMEMDVMEIGFEDVGWVYVVYGRVQLWALVNT